MFEAKGMEKQKELVEAEKKAEELSRRFMKEGIQITNDLIEGIEEIKLASRFKNEPMSEEGVARRGLFSQGATSTVPNVLSIEIGKNEGEVGLKKAQLIRDAKKIQAELNLSAEKLKILILDIKASQIE